MKKKEENQEELVKMEEKMVEELDKEYKDKLAALTLALEKEKQEKRSEIAEKVKVEQKRQANVDLGILDDLEKQQKTAEAEMMADMWKQIEEEEEEEKEEGIGANPPNPNPTPPPAPDCPICYEPMVSPTRIFQCGAGHLVCGRCKPKLQVFNLSHHGKLEIYLSRFKQYSFQECPSKCGHPLGGPAVGMESYVAQIRTHI